MTAIPNPAAAIAYQKALREHCDTMVGAIETNNAELFMEVLFGISDITDPTSSKAETCIRAVLLDRQNQILLGILRTVKNHDDSPVLATQQRLRIGLLEACVAQISDPDSLSAEVLRQVNEIREGLA